MKYIKIFEEIGLNQNDLAKIPQTKRNIHQLKIKNRISGDPTIRKELSDFYCDGRDLESLEGIEEFTNLKELNCYNNNLTSLEGIENLYKLESLSCHSNDLCDLKGIENLINLKILYCSNNNLKNVKEIENLINLEKFYCHENEISNLEFGDFSIDAFELGIDETNLRKFKKLQNLIFYGNPIPERYRKYIVKFCKSRGIEVINYI